MLALGSSREQSSEALFTRCLLRKRIALATISFIDATMKPKSMYTSTRPIATSTEVSGTSVPPVKYSRLRYAGPLCDAGDTRVNRERDVYTDMNRYIRCRKERNGANHGASDFMTEQRLLVAQRAV